MVLYSISIVMIGWEIFENSKQENLSIILLVLISIMPIIWGEWTKGPKASLTMYTSMVPLFLPIGYAIHESSVNDWSFLGYEFSFYLWIILAISSVWNIYIFFTDTLPCRMTVTKIIKFMNNYGIKKFYTYDTSFNFPFANVIKDFYPDKYDIEYISSINKIKSGYVLVPCTSSKAAYYQSVAKIGPVGDYKADESLNSMIETREIQNYSVASFKTWGNSKYWQQTGNVVSLRDLILKEVDEETRFRGYAWLLDVEKKL